MDRIRSSVREKSRQSFTKALEQNGSNEHWIIRLILENKELEKQVSKLTNQKINLRS